MRKDSPNKSKKNVGNLIGIIIFVGIVFFTYKILNQVDIPKYQVISTNNEHGKSQINVSIDDMVDENTLMQFGEAVKDEHHDLIGPYTVNIYLNGHKTNQPWARIDFAPEIKLGYLSRTKGKNDSLKVNMSKIKGNVLAGWSGIPEPYDYALVDSAKYNLLKFVYANEEFTIDTLLAEKLANGSIKLKSQYNDIHGEYFIVNNNGDLEFYNKSDELFKTSKKVK